MTPRDLRSRMSKVWDWLLRHKLQLFLALLMVTISVSLRVSPYFMRQLNFEVGFDTGVYENFMAYYQASESWRGSLPAYPILSPKDQGFVSMMEPAFFVETGFILRTIDIDMHIFFRYYLPVLVCLLTLPIVYVLGKRLADNYLVGFAAAALFGISNLQIEAVNESYYKQIISMVVWFGAIYGFDRYLRGLDRRYFYPSVLAAGSLFFYHRPASMMLFLLMLVLLIGYVATKNKTAAVSVLKFSAFSVIVSLPAILPRLEIELYYGYSFLSGTLRRIGLLGTGQGRIDGGGAIPAVLQGFDHVLFGYVLVFAPLVLLTTYACYDLWRKKKGSTFIVLFAMLFAYVGLWFYFGNRIIFELDLLVSVLAGYGLVLIARVLIGTGGDVRTRRTIVIAALVSVLVTVASLALVYQSNKLPYIVNNLDGVNWINENVDTSNSIIFAPAYLSSNFIQKGYRVATWDYTLTFGQERPEIAAEEFILEAPSNLSYLESFFDSHPDYLSLDVLVLWGDRDLQEPLPRSGKFIPFDEYDRSTWFELSYEGRHEILSVYRFVSPF